MEQDLAARGFGLSWGHSRSYANVLNENSTGINGNSWLVPQLKALLFKDTPYGGNNPAQICIVTGANSSLWLTQVATGVYRPQFQGFDILTSNAGAAEFIWTDMRGRQTVFFDNSFTNPESLAGKLKAIIDPSGRRVNVTYDPAQDNRLTKIEQEEGGQTSGFYYDYVSGSSGSGLLASVRLEVNGQPVRRARYSYYQGEAGGSPGDLRSVTTEQYLPATRTWQQIERKHYRYYTSGEPQGFVHGLKFVIRGVAYQRMVEAGLDPQTAPETELANYADYHFQYDSAQRVVSEVLEGGRKTYLLSYEANPTNPGFADVNTWATRTVETLPDGNENRVYTSKAGQTVLKIFRDNGATPPREWSEYSLYDAQFHLSLRASPSAVESVTEPTSGDPTLTVNLKAGEGLIRGQVFYATTDPATGAVAGRLDKQTVRKGVEGTPVILRHVEYDTREAFGQTIYPLRAEEVYPEETTANPARTSYAYTWHLDDLGQPTFQILEKTVVLPVVSAGQNGSDTAGVERLVFDRFGRLAWHCDPRGAITFRAYDSATGALERLIEDVDTARISDVPLGWQTVAGWGLHLVSDYVNDSLGRMVQARGPWHEVQLQEKDTATTSIRRVQFTAYRDEAYEVRQATGYLTGEDPTAEFRIVGAVRLIRTNESGLVTDEIQSVRTCTCGPLTTEETFPQEKWSRWTRSDYDTWGRLYGQRVYHRIPVQGEDEERANYLETIYGYDGMGRRNRIIEPSGTIRRMVHDARGLVISNWIGTDDRGATANDPTGGAATGNNMRLVNVQIYDDGNPGGDGNLTEARAYTDDVNYRPTIYAYDYRNRRDTITQTDGTTTWITGTSYNNLDRPLQNSTSVVAGDLIARNRTFYDLLGRIYRRETDGVDPADGHITGTLASQNWYDLGTNVIKASQAGTTSFTKTVHDALNRPTVSYTACRPGTAGVPAGDDNDVASDTVLEQNEAAYDRGGNIIRTTRRQRFDDATGSGALQDVNVQPKARVNYTASWPDAIGRIRVIADYGTNGGAALVRPEVASARSETVLVTTNRYKDNGDANAAIDPMGLETRWENDQAGRRVKLIENYVDGCPDQSRISEYGWHASGQLERLTLVNSDTGNQVTRWVYGTTISDSAIADNNLLRAKIYPESDDRPAPLDAGPDGIYARLEYIYNAQGQAVVFTDADGTVHEYAYDKLGRLLSDAVSTLGPDVDGTILRIQRAYEVRGMLANVTSYNAASGGTVVNESAFTYDAFGNLMLDQQSHAGIVTGTTPAVAYTYANGSANTVRRTSTVYPDGKILQVFYGSTNSIDDHLSRVSKLQFQGESIPLVEYTYVGVAWQVRVGYAGPAVELTYKKQGTEPVGDGGDPYNGYDRFGRTQDIRWQTTT